MKWGVEVESKEKFGGIWGVSEARSVVVGCGVGKEMSPSDGSVAAEEALQAVAPNAINSSPVIITIDNVGLINALQLPGARAVRIR
jgi:hypothetical protein